MIGKVKYYNDNTDAYSIIGNDKNEYYGFINSPEIVIGDYVDFEYHIVTSDSEETRIADKIKLASEMGISYKLNKNKK